MMSRSKAASSSHGARPTYMIQPANYIAASRLASLQQVGFIPLIPANLQWLLISRIFALAGLWRTLFCEQPSRHNRRARLSREGRTSDHAGVHKNPVLFEPGRFDLR